MAFYLDTSALVKLVVAEQETPELKAWLRQRETRLFTSDLARTELLRVTRRLAPARVQAAREVLSAVHLARLGERVFKLAGNLEPKSLRSLDAIHLASALDLGADLDGVVTYDSQMADAAALNAVAVYSPGADS